MSEYTYEVYVGKDKKHYWRMKHLNGKTVADGAEGYNDRADLIGELVKIKTQSPLTTIIYL